MRYRLRHTTRYEYSSAVTLSHNEARLKVRELPWQHGEHAAFDIEPTATRLHERHDFFGNHVLYFAIQDVHDAMAVTATSEVVTDATQLPQFNYTQSWEHAVQQLRSTALQHSPDTYEARLFTMNSNYIKRSRDLAAFARRSFTPHRPLTEALLDLNARIFHEFTYDPEFSSLATPITEVMASKRGVCQDFAHLAIGALRSIGLAARYVSGYLETDPPPGQTKLIGADASHAWLSVWIPDAGWMDIDPTNGGVLTERYLTLGWGRDYADVPPLKGVMSGGGNHSLHVEVDVLPI
ncbi:transglutaminase N-terminal domain-containing protein [Salinispirillum marinum]|uniref:Transglutaminase N-terminal domain-containing protein n=2 Tax=Saccharospirillaceae TaxID=255527 RepID=A0ABV8BD97_9GAMM